MSDRFTHDPFPTKRLRLVTSLAVLTCIGLFALLGTSKSPETDKLPSTSRIANPNRAWFCPLTITGGSIQIASPNTTGSVDAVIATNDMSAERNVDVVQGQPSTIDPSTAVSGAPAGVSVKTPRDGFSVAHIYSATQPNVIPCQDHASTDITFVENSTDQGATTSVALFNPFFDPAVADISFDTSSGSVSPNTVEGVVVGPRSMQIVNTGAEIPRRTWITTHIHARSGRLVAEATQSSSAGDADRFVSLPAPGPAASWTSPPPAPEVTQSATFSDLVSVVNTADREVGVTVAVNATGVAPIEPFQLRVPAHGRIAIDLQAEPRVTAHVPMQVRVDGVDGAKVIATRATSPNAQPVGQARFTPMNAG